MNIVEASTSSLEDDLSNNLSTSTVLVQAPDAVLEINPSNLVLEMEVVPGSMFTTTATIQNMGSAAVTDFSIVPAATITVAAPTISYLAPGEMVTLTLTASPGIGQARGHYQDTIAIWANGETVDHIAFDVRVTNITYPSLITIENDQGRFVAGASVSLQMKESSVIYSAGSLIDLEYYETYQATAGDQGEVTFDRLEAGDYDLVVTAEHHEPFAIPVSISANTEDLQVTLTALPALEISPPVVYLSAALDEVGSQSVTLSNVGAAPLTGLEIIPPADRPWVALGTPNPLPDLLSGESQEFTILARSSISQTDYAIIEIQSNGETVGSVELLVHIGEYAERGLVLELRNDKDGTPPTSGTVWLTEQVTVTHTLQDGSVLSYQPRFRGTVNPDGTVRFNGLRPGAYTYVVGAEGYQPSIGQLTLPPATDLPISGIQPGRVAYVAKPGDQPLASALLSMPAGSDDYPYTIWLTADHFNYTWEITETDGELINPSCYLG